MKVNLKTYFKFLSGNKLYTAVSVLGFSIALVFVILIGVYSIKQQSYDNFHVNKDRIYQISSGEYSYAIPEAGPFIKEILPEVESYARVINLEKSTVQVGDKRAELQNGAFVDSTYLRIFTFPLVLGDEDSALTTGRDIVLSRTLASRLFGDESPIGKSLVLNDIVFSVTGIIANYPENTVFRQPDFLVNIDAYPRIYPNSNLYSKSNVNCILFLLAYPNTDLVSKSEVVEKALKEAFYIYQLDFPLVKHTQITPFTSFYFDIKYTVLDMNESGGSRTLMQIYGLIALLILVVATLNYVNMTVAQAGFRGKEAAIRRLLGSDRKSLIIQQFSESLTMLVVTFVLACLLALLFEPLFNQMLNTQIGLRHLLVPDILLVVLPFLFMLTILSASLPAMVVSRFKPIEVVRGSLKRKVKSSYSKILIVFQYVISMVLVISGMFIYLQTDFLLHGNKGFDSSSIYVLNYVAEQSDRTTLRSSLMQIAGVEQVAYSSGIPMKALNIQTIANDENGSSFTFHPYVVDSCFFDVYDIQVESTGLAVTDNSYWMNSHAIKQLELDSGVYTLSLGKKGELEIVGVISDFQNAGMYNNNKMSKSIGIRRLSEDSRPNFVSIRIAQNVDIAMVLANINSVYEQFAGSAEYQGEFIDAAIKRIYKNEIATSKLLSAFTILTLIITIMGVFAMSLYQVQQREKEIAVRKVNGATVGEILRMLNFNTLKLLLIGFLLASPIVYFVVNQWLEGFSDRVAITPWVFLGSLFTVLLLTTLSVTTMTWRTARANPIEVLKGE